MNEDRKLTITFILLIMAAFVLVFFMIVECVTYNSGKLVKTEPIGKVISINKISGSTYRVVYTENEHATRSVDVRLDEVILDDNAETPEMVTAYLKAWKWPAIETEYLKINTKDYQTLWEKGCFVAN